VGLTMGRSTEQANYREEISVLEWIGKRYMRMQTLRHEEQGFTLIELMVVIDTKAGGMRFVVRLPIRAVVVRLVSST
jgi:Prokaryotic N-terminal methylation motif